MAMATESPAEIAINWESRRKIRRSRIVYGKFDGVCHWICMRHYCLYGTVEDVDGCGECFLYRIRS